MSTIFFPAEDFEHLYLTTSSNQIETEATNFAKEGPLASPTTCYNEEASENSTDASQGFGISRQNSDGFTISRQSSEGFNFSRQSSEGFGARLRINLLLEQEIDVVVQTPIEEGQIEEISPYIEDLSSNNKSEGLMSKGSPSTKESDDENCLEEEDLGCTMKFSHWTIRMDRYLKALTTKHRYDWKKIAQKFNEKEGTEYNALDLKQRFRDITRSAIPMRVKFTHEEDLMLCKYFEIYGYDWAKIATFFTDRTALMLKNRYYSHIRKNDLLDQMLKQVHEDKVESEIVKVEAPFSIPSEETEVVVNTNDNFMPNFDIDWDFRFLDFSIERFDNIIFDMNDALRSDLSESITVKHY